MAAANYSSNSSGGGGAWNDKDTSGSHKLSRKQKMTSNAVALEATVSHQGERIQELESQLKAALEVINKQNEAVVRKEREPWKEESTWQEEESWKSYSWREWKSEWWGAVWKAFCIAWGPNENPHCIS